MSKRAAPWMLSDNFYPDKRREILKAVELDDAFLVVVQSPGEIYVETWRRRAPAVRCWVRIRRSVNRVKSPAEEVAAKIRWGEERCASLEVQPIPD